MPLESHGCCSVSSSTPPVTQHTLVFWMGCKRIGSLRQHATCVAWESRALTLNCGRNCQLKRFFLALSCAALREGWQRYSETISFTHCVHLRFFFAQGCVRTSPPDSWPSPKGFLSIGGCQNRCMFFVGKIMENSYFTTFLMSLLFTYLNLGIYELLQIPFHLVLSYFNF